MRAAWLSLVFALAGCDPDPTVRAPVDALVASEDAQVSLDMRTPRCPPAAPQGGEIGQYLADLRFANCEGAPVRLHDLCGADAALIVNFYGWCTGCYRYLEAAAEIDAQYAPEGLQTVIVVSEDALEVPATAEYCAQIQARYAPDVVVVFDPELRFEQTFGGADTVVIADDDARIVFRRRSATIAAIIRAIEAEIAR